MLRYVFKRKGRRVFRGRYRIGRDPQTYDVPLHTDKKHVAEARLREIAEAHELEATGLGPSRAIKQAAERPVVEHLEDFLRDLRARQCSSRYLIHSRCRLTCLAREAGWKRISDISADSFLRWRAAKPLSPATLNHYLGHAEAFANWLIKTGRLAKNPLVAVAKAETVGHEKCVRRALSEEELSRLIRPALEVISSADCENKRFNRSYVRRALVYLFAARAGLRRSEIKALVWSDLRLDDNRPFVQVRASTTKNGKAAGIPIVAELASALRAWRGKERSGTERVFARGTYPQFQH